MMRDSYLVKAGLAPDKGQTALRERVEYRNQLLRSHSAVFGALLYSYTVRLGRHSAGVLLEATLGL